MNLEFFVQNLALELGETPKEVLAGGQKEVSDYDICFDDLGVEYGVPYVTMADLRVSDLRHIKKVWLMTARWWKVGAFLVGWASPPLSRCFECGTTRLHQGSCA